MKKNSENTSENKPKTNRVKKEVRIKVELENGNVVYASSYGDMLHKASLQNTRIRDYNYEE